MVIRRKILEGRQRHLPWPIFLTGMLTRDMFAIANLIFTCQSDHWISLFWLHCVDDFTLNNFWDNVEVINYWSGIGLLQAELYDCIKSKSYLLNSAAMRLESLD